MDKSSSPSRSGAVYLLDGKPHRLCDCPRLEGKCPLGVERTLQTTQLSQCLLPADDVLYTATDRELLERAHTELHYLFHRALRAALPIGATAKVLPDVLRRMRGQLGLQEPTCCEAGMPKEPVASEKREPIGLFWQTSDGKWHFSPGSTNRGDIHDNGRPIHIAYLGEEAAK